MSSPSATRTSRSNRAQGDVFELLVVRDTAVSAASDGATFDYATELNDATERVRAAHGAEAAARVALQETNAAAAAPEVAELVRARAAILGPVRKVRWIGRDVGLDVTVADVEIEHDTGHTRLSCKSTQRGSGTLRNLGSAAILELLGVDAGCLNKVMYADVLAALRQISTPERYAQLAALTIGDRKDSATEAERAAAAVVGTATATLVADAVQDALEHASQEVLRVAAAAALGIPPTPDPDLFVLVANPAGAHVSPALPGVPAGTLTARRLTPVRVAIYCDDTKLFAWQFNCTNGKGLSPLCQRSFLK